MALMVVLWVLAFLGVVFMSFTFSMRTELGAAGNFREQAETHSLAEAGIYRAATEIINADRNADPDSTLYDALDERWHANPGAYENVPLGRGTYQVTVSDEESKIPLNGATDAILRRLFSNSGVRDGRLLSTIVDSILDWRDPDTLHRLNGAEDDYYLSLPAPYRAKNGDFETMDELLLVKGMTPEILYGNVASPDRRAELETQLPWERHRLGEYLGVARHLSVFGTGHVNVNTASPEVLMALGLTAGETKLVLGRRDEVPFRDVIHLTSFLVSTVGTARQGSELVPAGQPGVAPMGQTLTELQQIGRTYSRTFYVESTGRMSGSRIASRIAAVLQNVGPPGRPKLSVRLWSLDPRQGA
ncbi:MAG: general secretion pathway protein GspK [candidate division NC10 bacterium]|nr:general secretion pathway protein GspK [candidate division NC10 bacterium]